MTDTTYVGPTPGSGQYGLYKAQADAAYAAAQGRIAQQRSQFLQGQGLSGEYDANGAYTGFHVNADNPSGAYQQMNSLNAQQGAQADAAIGAVGFKGGLATQAHEAAQQGYSANAAQWAQNAIGGLGQLQQAGLDATSQHNNDLFTGLNDSIQAAIANGTFNPADFSGITIDGQTLNLPPGPPISGTGSGGTTPWHPPSQTPQHPKGWTGKGAYGFGKGLHGKGKR